VNGGATSSMEPLRMFRDRFYAGLGRRADALFELCDAILTAGRVPSPPHLSLVSVHRRGWGSLYAALSKGRIDSEALRDLLASYDLGTRGTPVYAVDVSPWPRCDAEASPVPKATSTIHLAIRQAGPSSPAGPTSSWLDLASSATPGWRQWMFAGLSQKRIPTA
jgi:hypothetical protein